MILFFVSFFRRFRTLPFLICLGLFAGAGHPAQAMGAARMPYSEDIAIPADWEGLRFYAAHDDPEPLAPDMLRLYRVPLAEAPAALPASVRQQAALAAPLAGLAATPGDVTAAARARGVDLEALARAGFGPAGKYTMPETLLAVPPAALFHTRISPDRPDDPVTATLYCLPAGAERVTIAYVGHVPPATLPAVARALCGQN